MKNRNKLVFYKCIELVPFFYFRYCYKQCWVSILEGFVLKFCFVLFECGLSLLCKQMLILCLFCFPNVAF